MPNFDLATVVRSYVDAHDLPLRSIPDPYLAVVLAARTGSADAVQAEIDASPALAGLTVADLLPGTEPAEEKPKRSRSKKGDN